MTIEEYITSKSTLPTTGVYTMLEHLQHMLLQSYGEAIKFVLNEKDINIRITETDSKISIKDEDTTITIVVTDPEDVSIISSIINVGVN